MHEGQIKFQLIDNTCIIKLIGAIIYKISPDFDNFLNKIVKNPVVNSFILDLTETTYIDSTNLGLLAKIHSYSNDWSKTQPTIVSTQDNINEILHNIGFANMFNIIECLDLPTNNYQELDCIKTNQKDLAQVMYQAHKDLITVNIANKELFKDVIMYLKQDLEKDSFI